MTDHTKIAVADAAPIFPPIYALSLNLNGATVEGYAEGDYLTFDTAREPKAGDLVAVHFRSGGCHMFVLTLGLPPHGWARMPYREQPGSTALAVLVGKPLGVETEKSAIIQLQNLWAVHRCFGKADPEEVG